MSSCHAELREPKEVSFLRARAMEAGYRIVPKLDDSDSEDGDQDTHFCAFDRHMEKLFEMTSKRVGGLCSLLIKTLRTCWAERCLC